MMGMAERPWFVELYETRPEGRRLPIQSLLKCPVNRASGIGDRQPPAGACVRGWGRVGTGPGPAAGLDLLVALVQPISEFSLQ